MSKGLEVLKESLSLKSLSLTNNKFKDFDSLKPLADLQLTHLDVDGNEFSESKEEFRKKMFELLPSLVLLDGADKDGVEVNSDDDEDNEEDDEEDLSEEEESAGEEESEDEDGPGLSALYDNTADLDEDDEADYDADGAEAESEEDEDEDDDDVPQAKGVKRKHDEEDNTAN